MMNQPLAAHRGGRGERRRTRNPEPARKGNHHLRCEGYDQQSHRRQALPLHPYRHYPSPQHCTQIADTFSGRAHHLRYCKQTGRIERYQRLPIKNPDRCFPFCRDSFYHSHRTCKNMVFSNSATNSLHWHLKLPIRRKQQLSLPSKSCPKRSFS